MLLYFHASKRTLLNTRFGTYVYDHMLHNHKLFYELYAIYDILSIGKFAFDGYICYFV